MIISDRHQFILTLPQKCASGTLQGRFRKARDVQPYGQNAWYCETLRRIVSAHIPIKDIVRLKDFKKRRHYFRASFVRNPYDRIYSWFQWIGYTIRQRMEEGRYEESCQAVERGEDPEGLHARFVRGTKKMLEELEACEGDFNRFLTLGGRSFPLNSNFTHHRKRQWVNFIGRVELFEPDFDELCKRIGYKSPHRKNDKKSFNASPLPKAIPETVEEHKYLEHYSSASIELINKVMHQDFELLGYRKM